MLKIVKQKESYILQADISVFPVSSVYLLISATGLKTPSFNGTLLGVSAFHYSLYCCMIILQVEWSINDHRNADVD